MKKKLLSTIIICIGIALCSAYADSLTVESDKQEYKESENKIYLEGDVKVQTGDVNVISPRAVVQIDPKNNKVNKVDFEDNAYSFQLQDGKKHEIKAQIIEMSLLKNFFSATGNTISSITEKDKPVVIITADRQEYNKETNVMKAHGNVNIVYKDLETFSDVAIVDLTKDNDVKKIQLIGNSKLNQNKSTINARKITYDNVIEVAVAIGSVYSKLYTEDDKIVDVWSDYQSYDKKINVVTASGNTKIKYEDYLATGPKVNVYPDKQTKKLNEAVFVGRSKIETKGRTIEADRIAITMNPKDFTAEGNVKSVIPNVGKMK